MNIAMTNQMPRRDNDYTIVLQKEENYSQFNSEAFIRELEADLNEGIEKTDGYGACQRAAADRIPVEVRSASTYGSTSPYQRTNRPRLTNTFMLKGLVERSQDYNKTIDQRVMTDARIAFEEEPFKRGTATNETEVLATSSQNTQKRGRGDCFGRMRSSDTGENGTSTGPPSPSFSNNMSTSSGFYNNPSFYKKTELNKNPNNAGSNDTSSRSAEALSEDDHEKVLSFQSPRRFGFNRLNRTGDNDDPPFVRHHFNPETAYKGKITPDFRFNYNPQAAVSSVHVPPMKSMYQGIIQPVQTAPITPIRAGQRYPKRPDNNPELSVPKHLNHNYYKIELYGATQEERTAQRIEKTVRQTEAPLRRF